MTVQEKQMVTDYLRNGEEGDFVENDGRIAEVSCMCGGRYIFYDENGELSGQADNELLCIKFLEHGGFVNERFAGDAVVVI